MEIFPVGLMAKSMGKSPVSVALSVPDWILTVDMVGMDEWH